MLTDMWDIFIMLSIIMVPGVAAMGLGVLMMELCYRFFCVVCDWFDRRQKKRW